jgi:hypothetical protein
MIRKPRLSDKKLMKYYPNTQQRCQLVCLFLNHRLFSVSQAASEEIWCVPSTICFCIWNLQWPRLNMWPRPISAQPHPKGHSWWLQRLKQWMTLNITFFMIKHSSMRTNHFDNKNSGPPFLTNQLWILPNLGICSFAFKIHVSGTLLNWAFVIIKQDYICKTFKRTRWYFMNVMTENFWHIFWVFSSSYQFKLLEPKPTS